MARLCRILPDLVSCLPARFGKVPSMTMLSEPTHIVLYLLRYLDVGVIIGEVYLLILTAHTLRENVSTISFRLELDIIRKVPLLQQMILAQNLIYTIINLLVLLGSIVARSLT